MAPAAQVQASMSESENLILEDDRFRIRIAQPDGLLFVGGLANSYCVEYSNEINFENVITEAELKQIIRAFNDQIQSYWPCTACYVFGIGAACCTLGISLFVPNMCISEAEKAGKKCLHTYSLKREYYDSKIQFALVKVSKSYMRRVQLSSVAEFCARFSFMHDTNPSYFRCALPSA